MNSQARPLKHQRSAALHRVRLEHDVRAMKLKMTVDEAIVFADEWSRGMTIHEGSQGWRVVCMILADEVRNLRRGEFICQKCGLRKDDEHEHGEF